MSNHIETKCIHGNLDFSWDEPTKAVRLSNLSDGDVRTYRSGTFDRL